MHGLGTFSYANGSEYRGQWVRDFKCGEGILDYANGDRYEGEWLDGLPHGRGRMRYDDGRCYDGEYQVGVAVHPGTHLVWRTAVFSLGRKRRASFCVPGWTLRQSVRGFSFLKLLSANYTQSFSLKLARF